ncbi:tyrosine-type recombinase/integrase [Terrihalobacillus insolitus]|uniref:tyrosine-type recombinase/integrase n=1 Tax=Terrihalobacillus insolitus TaxID=2950438 RepID=UPI002FEE1DDC
MSLIYTRFTPACSKCIAFECLKWGAPHFRHAAATHWLENGMNIGEIQYLLGHENIQTTMVYLEITVTQEASAMKEIMTEEEVEQPKLWKKDIQKLRDLCKN